MKPSDHRMGGGDWALLGVLSVLWGGSFFFNGVALKELPPFTRVFLRVALAALILLPALWAYRIGFPRGLSGWRPFFGIALLNNVLPFSLIVMGQTYVPSGLASILNATTPLFTVLVMAASGDEKLSMRRVGGVLVGLIGVIILHGQDLDFNNSQGVGSLLCLAAAFSYGLSALYARRKLSNSPPLATATFQLVASSLMMAVVAALIDRPWQLPMPGATTWLAGGIVDRACLYRIFSDPETFGLDQRHAGDAADSGDSHPARLSRAGRTHFRARDHRRPCDRQRAAPDRRPCLQSRSPPARGSITSPAAHDGAASSGSVPRCYCSKVRTPVAPESLRIMRPFRPSAVTKTSQCAVPPGWPSRVIVPVQSVSSVYVPRNVSRCATVWRRDVCLPRNFPAPSKSNAP
jgi:drug/metabolite transporter (DMT)-like permease